MSLCLFSYANLFNALLYQYKYQLNFTAHNCIYTNINGELENYETFNPLSNNGIMYFAVVSH